MRALFLVSLSVLSLAAASPAQSADPPAISRSAASAELSWGPCPEFMPEGCAIAVLHGDPAQPNADVFFRVPAGSVIPAHRHTSAERMVLVSGQMDVTYEGQDPVTLRSGDYAYGPAGRVHSATCAQGAACVLFIAFEQPVDATAAAMPD